MRAIVSQSLVESGKVLVVFSRFFMCIRSIIP